VTALRNALREGRIAHAYLFSGIRGIGKTSVARILAKALNCERGVENGPCNECDTCRDFASASNMDILEIDAATYSKVEQVRELTENLQYKPVHLRYKVVVLDEVHRLSRQAFDALLKIIEEPPEHLVFIFATTELASVPATILSRCQEFNFRRVSRHLLMDHLRRLADEEKISVGDKALRLVARASEGSVRDAVALLDQLATYSSGEIGDDEAGRILGGVDAALHHRVLAAMIDGDRSEVVDVIAEIEEEGWDPRHVYAEFLSYCRDALHLALGGSIESVDLLDDEARAAGELAARSGYENLLRLMHQLLASEEAVRRSETGLLALEITWLRGAELPRLTQIETLLEGSPPTPGTTPSEPTPESSTGGQEPEERSSPVTEPQTPEPDGPPPEVAALARAAPVAPPSADVAGASGDQPTGVEGFLELIGRRRQVIAAHLGDVKELDFEDGCLTIVTAPGDTWLELALRRDANRQAFEACLEGAFGPGSRWQVKTGEVGMPPMETAAVPVAEPGAEAEPATAGTLEHPTVQAALDVFGGTAEAIDEPSS
jgi:DNA polymerase-3 subunit gamma/tau